MRLHLGDLWPRKNPEPAWFDHSTFYAEVAHARLRPEEMET
jgi:hypothetical protein